jgi:probable HAF family extracellular repeat protein
VSALFFGNAVRFKTWGGSFGGTQTGAEGLNDRGQTAGFATLPGERTFHAALWRHVGDITDLGVLGKDPCSFATSINGRTQVVGASMPDCNVDNTSRAFLWENGSTFDLNTLVMRGASLHLQWAQDINDHGEIAGTGNDANGNGHVYLLIPCDETHADVEGCDYSLVDASATAESPAPVVQEPTTRAPLTNVGRMPRRRLGPLSHMPIPTTGSPSDQEAPISRDSQWQLQDKLAPFDRAESAADSSSESSSDVAQNSCPAVRCSLNHIGGRVCGVRICHLPGFPQPIYRGYDRTYKRVCFYGCWVTEGPCGQTCRFSVALKRKLFRMIGFHPFSRTCK